MSDKMREEFEAAYLKDVSERFHGCEVGDDEWVARGPSGEYQSFRAAGAWWAWQASRESLVIELPIPKEVCGPDGSYMEYFEPEQIERAIEAAGLKVKP